MRGYLKLYKYPCQKNIHIFDPQFIIAINQPHPILHALAILYAQSIPTATTTLILHTYIHTYLHLPTQNLPIIHLSHPIPTKSVKKTKTSRSRSCGAATLVRAHLHVAKCRARASGKEPEGFRHPVGFFQFSICLFIYLGEIFSGQKSDRADVSTRV